MQRYDFFLNHQNFSKKKSLFSCIFYALLIYVNTQNGLHLIIYYIGRTVFAKSQEQRIERMKRIFSTTDYEKTLIFFKTTDYHEGRLEGSWSAVFLDITLQNLYSRRKQLLKSVFNIVGKPEKFDNLLQEQN